MTPQPSLSFELRGIPVPYSLRGGGNIHTTTQMKIWKNQVRLACEDAIDKAGWKQISGPVELHVEFHLLRRGKAKRKSAPSYPCEKPYPDTLSLLRPVEDALTDAGAWGDDVQVVKEITEKFFAPAGAEVDPSKGLVGVRVWTRGIK